MRIRVTLLACVVPDGDDACFDPHPPRLAISPLDAAATAPDAQTDRCATVGGMANALGEGITLYMQEIGRDFVITNEKAQNCMVVLDFASSIGATLEPVPDAGDVPDALRRGDGATVSRVIVPSGSSRVVARVVGGPNLELKPPRIAISGESTQAAGGGAAAARALAK